MWWRDQVGLDEWRPFLHRIGIRMEWQTRWWRLEVLDVGAVQ